MGEIVEKDREGRELYKVYRAGCVDGVILKVIWRSNYILRVVSLSRFSSGWMRPTHIVKGNMI